MEIKEYASKNIIRDMAEGVLTIGMNGRIEYLNAAGEKILEKKAEELIGKPFASAFFEYEENDGFNQTILDAVYNANCNRESFVRYYTGEKMKELRVVVSYQKQEGNPIGVICVLSDISELVELRDAVKAMEQIKNLNSQLQLRNKLISETFGRYLSDEIVKQLLDTPEGLKLGGKKTYVTVMMSDLRGFTALSERLEPEKLLDLLNHYLEEMTTIIQGHDGTIIEFIGDGIMAVFGVPTENDHHATDAVVAAVEMQKKMDDINRWNRERGYPEIEMGIGLNTGSVIAGNIGSVKRTKYGVLGSMVNLAGRVESYTIGHQVLISPTTRNEVKPELIVNQEIQVIPKGVKEPLVLSSVCGVKEPYNVSYEMKFVMPEKIDVPKKVRFASIKDKHTGGYVLEGEFTAISSESGILCTETELENFDNLEIDIGEKLFGKVLKKHEGGYLIRFTLKPVSFDAWRKA